MARTFLLFIATWLTALPATAASPWIIASGVGDSWPAGCPASLAAAVAHGADTLSIPVSMSRDGQVIVTADPELTKGTDAGSLFAEQLHADGTLLATDLDAEQLYRVHNFPPTVTGTDTTTVAPPLPCTIVPLPELLSLAVQLERDESRPVNLVIELRKPWLHHREQKDLGEAVMATLTGFPFDQQTDRRLFVASYDPEELARLHDRFPAEQTGIGLIQLLDTNDGTETMQFQLGQWRPYQYDWLFTGFGLRSIAGYTDAIGLSRQFLLTGDQARTAAYLDHLRALGIRIIAYPADPFTSQDTPEEPLVSLNLDGLMTGNFVAVRDRLMPAPAVRSPDDGPARTVDRLIEHLERRELNGTTPASPLLIQ